MKRLRIPGDRRFRLAFAAALSAALCLVYLGSRTGGFSGLLLGALALLLTAGLAMWIGNRFSSARTKEAQNLFEATVTALAMAIDAKDHRTFGSVWKVKEMAVGLARRLGLTDPRELDGLRMAALLHDIGKLAVPEYILSKPGKLTSGEAAKVREHPAIGAEILATIPFPYPVAELVRHHHERWDGSGYPDGLKGEAIPQGARILSVVDCYLGLRSDRPFRPRLSRELAFDFIRLESGTAFDPRIVEAFVAHAESLESELASPPAKESAPYPQFSGSHQGNADVFADIASTQREMRAIYEITQNVGSSLDVSETLAGLAARLQRFVPYSACSVYLLRPGEDRLLPHHAAGPFKELLENVELRLEEGISGWVAAHNRSLLNASPELDFPYLPQLHQAFRSCISVPLSVDGTVIGVLTLYSGTQISYDEEHLRLLEAVAPYSARAISNAVIYEATQEHAQTDPLTGLPNIRSFVPLLKEEIVRAKRIGYPVSVLMMDLDGFKRVNDRYGHLGGDALLVEVGRLLKSQLRRSDHCLRYGGDEFLALLPGLDRTLAHQAATRIQTAFGSSPLINLEGEDITLGISIGVATFPIDGIDPDSLVARADQDMYLDKADRKGRPDPPSLLHFRRSEPQG